jgi:hypothetical protein
MIDYDRIVPGFVGPKLSYHGVKYDEEYSYPPQGNFFFSRSYWCTTQRISIGPIEYDRDGAKAVIARGDDFPTEVPKELLLIREPGVRLWLSNRYLNAVLQCESHSIALVPELGIIRAHNLSNGAQRMKEDLYLPASGIRSPTWWEFHGVDDLRRTLKSIVSIIVSQGLDWFDEQVVGIKRYHDKLERRKQNAKRRAGLPQ